MKRLFIISLSSILIISLLSHPAFSQSKDKMFRTKFTTVYYTDDKDFSDFLWRIGGERFEFSSDIAIASSRIDRIVDRVKTILGMWIRTININIYLYRGLLKDGQVAYYDNNTGAIHISVENASEGVFAHEVAHAIINKYFSSPPSSKVQEILTQYVDKYLWQDY